MPISFVREKNERGVHIGDLNVGDTFLYGNRIGVIVERNGHAFPIDLTTCGNFRHNPDNSRSSELAPQVIVLPVDIEIHYKVVG